MTECADRSDELLDEFGCIVDGLRCMGCRMTEPVSEPDWERSDDGSEDVRCSVSSYVSVSAGWC